MITHTISLLGLRDSNEDQHEVFINLDNSNTEYKNINLSLKENFNLCSQIIIQSWH